MYTGSVTLNLLVLTIMKLSKIKQDKLVKFLEGVQARPGMYFLEPTYPRFTSYLDGLDFMADGVILSPVKEWLRSKHAPDNLYWAAGYIMLTRPQLARPDRLTVDVPDPEVMIELAGRLLGLLREAGTLPVVKS